MKEDNDNGSMSSELLERLTGSLDCDVERRDFIKKAGRWGGGMVLAASLGSLIAACSRKEAPVVPSAPSTAPSSTAPAASTADSALAVASGASPGELTREAVDALGGMGEFVKQGDLVVVKPNASFLDGLQNATTTDPEVVGEVVAMCKEAGASRVVVMDHVLCGSVEEGFGPGSGIGQAAEKSGGEIIAFDAGDDSHGIETSIPGAKAMGSASVYPEVLEAQAVITVPKAKHHSGTGLSLGMKNFIGVTSNMSRIHRFDTNRAIADLNTLVRPRLSVIDATVILLENGPGGPGEKATPGKVIASGDVVAADSYACTLFGLTARDVPYIIYGGEAGLGESDYTKLEVREV